MTAANEPTLGEVLRRLDEVSRQMSEMAREMKADRADAAKTYVRQDVYMAERHASQSIVADLHGDIQAAKSELGGEIKTLKDERKADVQARRQLWLALGSLAVTSLLAIIGLIVNYSTR